LKSKEWLDGADLEFSKMFQPWAIKLYHPEERGLNWVPWTYNDLVNPGHEDNLAEIEYLERLSNMSRQEHGQWIVKEFITYSPLVRAMCIWGPKKSAQVRYLRIIWGEKESGGDPVNPAGPSAIGLISLLCKAWLIGLKHIRLQQVERILNGRLLTDCRCAKVWPNLVPPVFAEDDETSRKRIMGISGGLRCKPKSGCEAYFVLALDMLAEWCPKVCLVCRWRCSPIMTFLAESVTIRELASMLRKIWDCRFS
jgi:hypothetical protein